MTLLTIETQKQKQKVLHHCLGLRRIIQEFQRFLGNICSRYLFTSSSSKEGRTPVWLSKLSDRLFAIFTTSRSILCCLSANPALCNKSEDSLPTDLLIDCRNVASWDIEIAA
jgi:hypothetical protein